MLFVCYRDVIASAINPVIPRPLAVSSLPDLSQEALSSLVLLSGLPASGKSMLSVASDTSSKDKEETNAQPKDVYSNHEQFQVKLGYLQITALKTLCTLLSSSKYVDYLVFHSFGKESTAAASQSSFIMKILYLVVSKAISPAPIARHVPLSELERACGMLVKCSASHDLGVPTEDANYSLEDNTLLHSAETNAAEEQASGGEEDTSLSDVRSPTDERPPALRRLHRARARLWRIRRHEAVERVGSASGITFREIADEEVLRLSSLRVAHEEMRQSRPGSGTTTAQPTPLQTQLLEMGFSLAHINHALSVLGSRFSSTSAQQAPEARIVNRLVTWMIDHPLTESDLVETERRGQERADIFEPPPPLSIGQRFRQRLEAQGHHHFLQRFRTMPSRSDETAGRRGHEEESPGDDSDNPDPFAGVLYSEDEPNVEVDRALRSSQSVVHAPDLLSKVETMTEIDDAGPGITEELSGDILHKIGVDSDTGFAIVPFGENDPLGASLVCQSKRESRRHTREGRSRHQHRNLGQQVAVLRNCIERSTAREMIVQSATVLLCRNVVARLLSLVVSLEEDSHIVAALKKIGLGCFNDLMKVGRLTSAGRMGMTFASKLSLADVGKMLGALRSDATAYDTVLHQLCSKELTRLAIKGTLQESNQDFCDAKSDVVALTSPSLPVMEMLVSVLIKSGPVQKGQPTSNRQTSHTDLSLTAQYANLSADVLSRIRNSNTSDGNHGFSEHPIEGRLALINGLAMCCLSSKLEPSKRQWATTELTHVLSDQSQKIFSSKDLRDAYYSDVNECPTLRLEGHQEQVGKGNLCDVCYEREFISGHKMSLCKQPYSKPVSRGFMWLYQKHSTTVYN
jgi:hypothetical protein